MNKYAKLKEKVLWDWTKLNQKKEEDNTNKIKEKIQRLA